MVGKVIAIVAPTRTGKSFLAEQLARHYGSPVLYEYQVEANSIPQEVQEGLRAGKSIAGWLYFRNRHAEMQLEACELAKKHSLVFLDSSWVSDPPYISFCDSDPFHQGLMTSIHGVDRRTLPWPNIIIMLTCDDATSEHWWRASGKNFESDETYFTKRLLPLKKEFERYINNLSAECPVIKIDRTNLDFGKPEDLKVVIEKVDRSAR